MSPRRIITPLTDDVVRSLHAGDEVLISGVIYTARDSAHKRLVEMLERGEELPFPLEGAIIYYVGPAPAPPGKPIGSAGPTTSYRMDPYAPALIEKGLKGMIGKGPRGEEVVEAMKKYGAVYFAATGGAAALIAKSIKQAEVIAFPELLSEAVRKLVVEDFPAIVAQDSFGGNIFEEGVKKYRKVSY
ncbi:MAG TPA: Fe-S-containing hydro-lyase [candidate division Zixibacteria bacterium]|nr:Fe-S-containing hydro-lyase [bacterium]HHH81140.1 Fe-S-containing hydro-lyase [candidate division Zixibacteria bacterium]